MQSRFTWILPLLLGAAIASLFWWQSEQPERVHAGLELGESQEHSIQAASSDRGSAQALEPGSRQNAGDWAAAPGSDTEDLEPGTAGAARGLVPTDSARVRVLLTDASSGAGLKGVKVVAYLESPPDGQVMFSHSTPSMRGSLELSPTSNDLGLVEFDLPPDLAVRLSVRPDPNTHQPKIHRLEPLNAFELRDVKIALPGREYTSYFGRVRNRQTGEMVSGAMVRVFTEEELGEKPLPATSDRIASAFSNRSGTFEIDASRSGAVGWIQAPGLSPTLIALDAAHDTALAAREIRMRPGGQFALDLRDAKGKGIPGALITISTSTYSLVQTDAEALQHRTIEWQKPTNAFGRAEFAALPSDAPLRIVIETDGRPVLQAPPMQMLTPGEARELRWTLEGGTHIQGQLHGEAGLPLAGQELWLLPASEEASKIATATDQARALHKTHSDQSGQFAFSGVPAGAWWITPAVHGDETRIAPLARRFDVPEGLSQLEVQFEVFPAKWVSGRVIPRNGEALGVHHVWLQVSGVSGHLTAWTDESGQFRLGPVAPGLVEVGVYPSADHTGSPATVCRAGEDQLRLNLEDGTRLVGILTTTDGSALPSVQSVLLTQPGGKVTQGKELEWVDLGPGNYGIFVRASDGRVGWTHRVGIGKAQRTGEAVLTLEPAATVRLAGPGDYRLWVEGACVGFGSLKAGETREVLVPVGNFRLERPDRNKPSEALRAKAGRVLDVDLGRASTGPGLAPWQVSPVHSGSGRGDR